MSKEPTERKTGGELSSLFGGIALIFMSIILGALYPLLGIAGEIFGLWITTKYRTQKEQAQNIPITPLHKRKLLVTGVIVLICWNIISISAYMEVENQKNVTAQAEISEPVPKPAPEAQPDPEPEPPAEPKPETLAKPEPEPKPEVQPAPAPAEEVKNPLLSATFSLDEVKSGIGNNVLGQYGYIKIDKKDLKTVTNEQFTEFAEQKVQDSGLNWVSIICDDGTGICFAGSISYVAEYGEVDTDGTILKSTGVIMLADSGYTYEQTT